MRGIKGGQRQRKCTFWAVDDTNIKTEYEIVAFIVMQFRKEELQYLKRKAFQNHRKKHTIADGIHNIKGNSEMKSKKD